MVLNFLSKYQSSIGQFLQSLTDSDLIQVPSCRLCRNDLATLTAIYSGYLGARPSEQMRAQPRSMRLSSSSNKPLPYRSSSGALKWPWLPKTIHRIQVRRDSQGMKAVTSLRLAIDSSGMADGRVETLKMSAMVRSSESMSSCSFLSTMV